MNLNLNPSRDSLQETIENAAKKACDRDNFWDKSPDGKLILLKSFWPKKFKSSKKHNLRCSDCGEDTSLLYALDVDGFGVCESCTIEHPYCIECRKFVDITAAHRTNSGNVHYVDGRVCGKIVAICYNFNTSEMDIVCYALF